LLKLSLNLSGDFGENVIRVLGVDTTVGTDLGPAVIPRYTKFPPPPDRAPVLPVVALDRSCETCNVEIIVFDQAQRDKLVLVRALRN
jgi:hypothetical protein